MLTAKRKPHKPKRKPAPSLWISTPDAAPLLGVTTAEGVRLMATRGTMTPLGTIRLESRWIGGRLKTRQEWIDQYIAAVSAAKTQPAPSLAPPLRETPDAQASRFEQEKRLAEAALSGNRPI